MQIVGNTKYIKNLKDDLNRGKTLAQTYLVVYSLLLPQIVSTVTNSKNNGAIYFITLYIFVFIVAIIMYMKFATENVNLKNLEPSINKFAILASMSFSTSLGMYLVLYVASTSPVIINSPAAYNNKLFIFFIFITCFLTLSTLESLLIKTKKEITINEIADELVRLRKNKVKEIYNQVGFTSSCLIIFVLLIYVASFIIIFNPTF